MRFSNSKLDLYKQCPQKYKFQYIDKLKKDETPAALLFGSAIDNALNYVLTCKQKLRIPKHQVAKWLFLRGMKKWTGQNPLIYFKGEQPPGVEEPTELQVWEHLCMLGQKMMDTYIDEILPEFVSISAVQIRKEIKNADGDELILIIDFVGTLRNGFPGVEDGFSGVFDNKTASQPYPKNSVKKSQQLAIYAEQIETRNAAYIVLEKKLKDGKVKWKIIPDTVEEAKIEEVYEDISITMGNIKAELFPKNEKSCYAFGRKCSYWGLCKYGSMKDIIKSDR